MVVESEISETVIKIFCLIRLTDNILKIKAESIYEGISWDNYFKNDIKA